MGKSLAQMQTIYVGALTGEPGFGRKLIEALQQLDRFEFTEERTYADAILEAHGEDQEDGFVGKATLRDTSGAVAWSAQVARPHGVSGPMAYERIVADLKHALLPLEASRTA